MTVDLDGNLPIAPAIDCHGWQMLVADRVGCLERYSPNTACIETIQGRTPGIILAY